MENELNSLMRWLPLRSPSRMGGTWWSGRGVVNHPHYISKLNKVTGSPSRTMTEPFLWSLLSIYLRGLDIVYVSPVKVCAITVHSPQKPTHFRVFQMRTSPGDAPALAYPTLRAALGLSLLDKGTSDIRVALPGSVTGGDGVQLRTSLPAASGRGSSATSGQTATAAIN